MYVHTLHELSHHIQASYAYIPGMMHYGFSGSLYEKNIAQVIPLFNFTVKFWPYWYISYKRLIRYLPCQSILKRNIGKWGILHHYVEHGNMYRSHVPKPSSYWTIQQTVNVNYTDKYGECGHITTPMSLLMATVLIGQQGIFNATIVR